MDDREQEFRTRAWAQAQARSYPAWLRLIGWMGYGRMMRRAITGLPEPPGRVLDVGTGTGVAARVAAEACPGARVVGVDLSGAFLAEARRAGDTSPIRFIQGSAAALPARDGAFDLVMSFGVICHTANAEAVIEEMRRVLRPGGTATLWTRGRGPSGQFLRLVFPLTSGGARFNLYSRRELRELFEAAGFAEVRVSGEAHGLLVRARYVRVVRK